MDMGENKRQHLQMVQDTISRMAGNSFLIKGWATAGLGGLFVLWLQVGTNDYRILILIFGLSVLLWGHDAYYLWLERRYRELYNEVSKKDDKDIDFSMRYKNKFNESVIGVAFRPILLWSYGIIIIVTIFFIGRGI